MVEHIGFEFSKNKDIWGKLNPYLEEEHACIVCGSFDFVVWAKEGYLEAKECVLCGMISVNPHFTEQGLKLFYSEYFSYRKENMLLNEQRDDVYIIDRDWVSLFVKGGRVLDVGCSGGYFLSKFPTSCWDRYGVEIAADAGQYAMDYFDIQVRIGDVVELDFDEKFDLIMMRGTIEHMHDPIATLEKCCQLLNPNGFLFITATPAGDSFAFDVYREKWRLFTPLEHIHFFSVNLLTRVLEKYGLKLISFNYQYEETPYANQKHDFKQIKNDISLIQRNRREDISSSVPFPGSMLTALWQNR